MKRLSRISRYVIFPTMLLVGVVLLGTSPLAGQATAQSPREALELFNDAVNLQNNSAFDVAADEYRKFLKRFPSDPLALKARCYLASCLARLNKLEEAVKEYDAVLAGAKDFPLRQDAYVDLGACQFALGRGGNAAMYEKAAATYAAMVKEFPKSKHADEAIYFQGEALYAVGQKAQAVDAYNKVVTGFPESKRRADSLYALGATQQELGNFVEAGKTYDIFLKEFADHDLSTEVLTYKAETLLRTDKVAPAEKLFAEAAAVEGFKLADQALYGQAECVLAQKKFAEAGDLFAKVATDFPQSEFSSTAIMNAGQAYWHAKRDDDAANWFDKVVAAGEKDAVEAAHWRCRIHLRKGQPAKAAALAAKTLPQATESPFLVSLKMDQADGLYDTPDRRAESLPLYLQIVSQHPDHTSAAQALYNAAYTAMDLEKYDEALTHANAFLGKYANHALLPDARYVSAECLLLLGKYAESEKLYRELTAEAKDRPELATWQLRLAAALYQQKKRKEVVETLTPLIPSLQTADQKAEAQFLVGTSQYYLGQYDAAVKALEASLAANPNWTQSDEAWLNLSRAQRKQNQLDAAIKSVKRMLEGFPQSKLLDSARYRLGEYSYAAGDYPTAITEYDAVLANWPNSIFAPYAQYGKGWAQLRSKAHADAAKSLTALIEGHADHPLVPGAQNARASCRYHTGDFQGGIVDVNSYLESKPGADERANALFVRELCEVGAKKYADATKTFETILSEKPNYDNAGRVLYELGWAYKSDEKEDEAVKAFTRLTGEHADNPLAAEAFYHVGESQYKAKKFAEAAKSYAAAQAKAGQGDMQEKSSYKLGWANYQLKQYTEALDAFSNQVATHPQGGLFTDGMFMKGECLFKLERYDEALETLLKCQGLAGYSDEIRTLILLHAGQSASQSKMWQKAIELLEKIPAEHPGSDYVAEALYEQGFAKQNLDETDAAKKLYGQAADKSRTAVGARARFMLGELHFAEKNYAEAIKEFQRVVFGYGGDTAPESVKKWQSKSAYEVARCNDVQIAGAKTPAERQKYTAEAKRFYGMVAKKFPKSSEAALAAKRGKEL